ncbi:MAG: UDP-glucose/GDP-mannose dehydrogenase family protein [Elusimicrobia bacterium]|nr:UDP-glucose/GDP-mannose dehydrogenase family protein [Elusimicrobiota bacterium]
MKVAVIGLGHLGTVTAACAAAHFDVAAYDLAPATISEPGLDEALSAGKSAGRLSFKTSLAEAVKSADLIWFTHETPVSEDDAADVGFLEKRMKELLPHVPDGGLVLISSQVPVGFTAWAEAAFKKSRPKAKAAFACSPENLQLGRALDAFRRPERVIVGARDSASHDRLAGLFSPFCSRLERMSPESAEMTKHALNAFLATSVVFINETARLCESVGADAKEVERGLKSEPRIGPKAYLRPGGAFSGGTLARDINYLVAVAKKTKTPSTLFAAVYESNEEQKLWPREQLKKRLRTLKGKTVAVWGLSYKAGTNSIRRSAAIELCRWLLKSGARVQAYDPAVRTLPAALKAVTLCDGAADALRGADALVVAVEWPDFRMIPVRTPVVVDAGGFLRRPS